MRIKVKILFLIGVVVALAACSNIGEDERLIYVKPAPAKRVVLLEDFTGQRCVNCPLGAEVIEQLEQTYGDTALIAVSIHGGPLGFAGNARYVGLATEAGDKYFAHWGLEYQPVALVNRHEAVRYIDWTAAVREEMNKQAPLEMSVHATLSDGQIEITVGAYGTDGQVAGQLQVWIVEDHITALQMMPDATANTEYVHRHVLRAPVNGLWGEAFSIEEGERKEVRLTSEADESWDEAQLSVVAFVYNDGGVLQAAKTLPLRSRGSLTPDRCATTGEPLATPSALKFEH